MVWAPMEPSQLKKNLSRLRLSCTDDTRHVSLDVLLDQAGHQVAVLPGHVCLEEPVQLLEHQAHVLGPRPPGKDAAVQVSLEPRLTRWYSPLRVDVFQLQLF